MSLDVLRTSEYLEIGDCEALGYGRVLIMRFLQNDLHSVMCFAEKGKDIHI